MGACDMTTRTLWYNNRKTLRGVRAGLLPALLLASCLGGCPFLPAGSTPIEDPGDDTFADATIVTFDGDQAEYAGSISSSKDVDMYDLGVLAPGDRLRIDIQSTSGGLDPMAAVFDEREYILAFSDDREPDGSNLNPLIDVLVQGARGNFYLGVVPYYNSGSTGGYRVNIQLTRAVGILDPEPQIVFLNWSGGKNLIINNVGQFDLDPFDAADVGPFAGRTDELKDAIQDVVADRYDGFNLVLMNSDDHAVPTDPHSTVHFGGKERSAFAIAEQVDTFNVDQSDDAIIFTDSFRDAFSITPTLIQMAEAIGNTAAHEIGHLLGLVHTKDCSGLMDTTCGNDSLLREQVFKLSPLDDTVFPFGMQNAVELIEWAIGLSGG